jgi:hypothetical protein
MRHSRHFSSKKLEKPQILEAYLNRLDYGNRRIGRKPPPRLISGSPHAIFPFRKRFSWPVSRNRPHA